MGYNLEEGLNDRFSEYLRLIPIAEPYLAIANLVQIHHCLSAMDAHSRTKWDERLNQLQLTEEVLKAAELGVDRDVKYIERVLSIGTIWNDDEILLVLQQRIFVDLFLDFYRYRFNREIPLDLDRADRLIKSVARTPENKRSYEIAIRLMKKNWGLPIRSKWLNEEFYWGETA